MAIAIPAKLPVPTLDAVLIQNAWTDRPHRHLRDG
ncbi:hypothetical protein Q604_UNBC16781G0001, partial [human gut metagenome]